MIRSNIEIVGKNNDSVVIVITINRVVLVIQSIRSSSVLNSNSHHSAENDVYRVPTLRASVFEKIINDLIKVVNFRT